MHIRETATTSGETKVPDVSRRAFLKATMLVVGAGPIRAILHEEPVAAAPTPRQPETVPQNAPAGNIPARAESALDKISGWYDRLGKPKESLIEDTKLMVAGHIASIVLGVCVSPLGLSSRDKYGKDTEEGPRVRAKIVHNLSTVPAKEETLFRALPSAILSFTKRKDPTYKSTSGYMPIATISSIAFGLWHNRYNEGKALYLEQATIGMALWRINRNGGIIRSTMMHAASNAVAHGVESYVRHAETRERERL